MHTAIISGGASFLGLAFFVVAFFRYQIDFFPSNLLGMGICLIITPFQIYKAHVNHLQGRNWSNFANALSCLFVSSSIAYTSLDGLFEGVKDMTFLELYGAVSAVGGFFSVGILSFVYWWHTSRLINSKK